ncbi:MAG TPA: MBL fold metallo-hydrolase [Vicinamibacterales bacterium]|nr:MBL fold metallo-hydrolase [Vicinamibacterales bacterium]
MTDIRHMSFNTSISRREMLRRAGLISGAAALVAATPNWVWALHAQGDQLAQMRAGMAATPITSQSLGPNLTMLAGPGGNVVVLNGPDGKVVVDTFVQPAWSNLKAALDKIGSQRIATVIDTHWHFDHADNNESFRKEGAAIVAHENTKARMGQSHELLGAKIPPAPAAALPTRTFTNMDKLDANGEQIVLGHIPPAHTDTDIYIKFQKANVLHLGDVFFNGMYPFIDASTGGSIGGMINGASMAMKQADAKTQIVPGHGPVGDLAALTRYHEMLVAVRDRIAKLKKSGQTVQQVVAAQPTKDLDATWGKGFMQPADFLAIVYNTIK